MNDRRPRTALQRLVVLITALVLLALWVRTTAQHTRGESLRPEKTKRAIAARSKPKPLADEPPPSPTPATEEAFKSVTLWLHPKAEDAWEYPNQMDYQIYPANYWPMGDEAPWPDIESADALQDLAEALRDTNGKPGEAAMHFLEQAEQDDLFNLADTLDFESPWTGLVAMQAEFVETFRQVGFWPEAGTVDYTRDRTLAQHIVDTWPDDPAAEYARLHLLQISHVRQSAHQSTEEAIEWIEDIIVHTQDSLVLDVALAEFTLIDKSAFNEQTIEAIGSVYTETSIKTQRGIIHTMMNHYAQTEDWAQLDVWATKLIAHEKEAQWDPNDPSPMNTQSILSDLVGYRAVRGGDTPQNWQEEVSTVVHMCHEDHPFEILMAAEAEWSDGWRWNAWWELNTHFGDTTRAPDAPNFIDCVQLNDWQHEPSQPTLLTIKIVK